MSFQSLNPELMTKILYLANLQRNLIQNQLAGNDKIVEENNLTTTSNGPQSMHPLLMPSLNVSSQKISAMLAALTPPSSGHTSTPTMNILPLHQSASTSHTTTNNNNGMNLQTTSSPTNGRSNGSSFGWGNRERKMEENWRMQNRSI